ncbi:MAG: D-aminoacylase [Bryobacteraceae bacterium]|nr:D-aminoacylase [Bryobacteraceae bacterium]
MRALLALIISTLALAGADYDWLFRNVRVVDGSGNPWYYADVAVKDGKIAAVGDLENAESDRVVDGVGRVLAPGFIDVHTHVERTIKQVPGGDNFVSDGVTTVVTGNCGGSETDLEKWFKELEEIGLGLNLASLIGHNSVRAKAMGTEKRAPTPEELARMQDLVREAMRAGAVGFSTGLIYVPGTYADTDEIVALAKAAASYGGVYATHMRDEGEQVQEAIQEAILIGKASDLPVQISHFKLSSRNVWGASEKSIALVEQAREEGVDVVVDQYPYDRSSTTLNVMLPSWALEGGRDKLLQRLRDPEERAKILAGMEEELKKRGHPDYSFAIMASFEADPALEGKTISEINQGRGREKTVANEMLTILEIVNQGPASMVYHNMSMEDVERILKYPNTAVASDGGVIVPGEGKPHPRSYGTNARVLSEFVRQRKSLSLEDAIRRMTSLPARTFGFRDRGFLLEGFAADLVLFDPDQVRDRATFDDPHRYSDGFDFVLVNGKAVVEDGKLAGRRAGRVLRRHATGHEALPTQ